MPTLLFILLFNRGVTIQRHHRRHNHHEAHTSERTARGLWRPSEVRRLKTHKPSSEFLPSCDGFGENRVHDAFPSEVPARGWGLSLLDSLLCSWKGLSGAGQRRDQLHLGNRKRLWSGSGSGGGIKEKTLAVSNQHDSVTRTKSSTGKDKLI